MSQNPSGQKVFQETDPLLTRSRTEIAKILVEISRQGIPVTATLHDGEQLFITRILQVDAEAGRLMIAYSQSKAANSTLLAARTVVLHVEFSRSRVVLRASSPVDVAHEKQPGIRLDFPQYLVRLRQRTHPRFRIPSQMGLKCVVECPGFLPFELEVVDISLEGQGMMLSDPGIRLDPGTILKNCRIVYPGRRPIVVDMEIRYSKTIMKPDGSEPRRVGCRFLGNATDIADLVKMFSVKLDDIP
jgi:c-di-GMP-binding flagellar brake protein YcgR